MALALRVLSIIALLIFSVYLFEERPVIQMPGGDNLIIDRCNLWPNYGPWFPLLAILVTIFGANATIIGLNGKLTSLSVSVLGVLCWVTFWYFGFPTVDFECTSKVNFYAVAVSQASLLLIHGFLKWKTK